MSNQIQSASEAITDDSRAPAAAADADRTLRWQGVTAALLGMLILFGVGFAPGLAHNAAHDTRHTLAFPCH